MSATTTDETWLNRVNALLAKAESTDFPEESEALLAKAQELMARHAIDEAMLAAAGRGDTDAVVSDAVVVDPPYATAKASLLGTVARANHCRVVMAAAGNGAQRCVVVGHPSDLASVRTLFAALSVHAVRSMLAATVPPYDTVRRYRHAFILAFSMRIGERLRAASAEAESQARAAATDAPGFELVLADRRSAVDQAFAEAFPHVRSTTIRASSTAGMVGGRRAADRAGLGQAGLGGTARRLPRG